MPDRAAATGCRRLATANTAATVGAATTAATPTTIASTAANCRPPTVGARLTAQPLDTARVLGALRDAGAACRADAGRLWGRSLCGPVALVDPGTRLVVANDTVPERGGVPYAHAYVTTLPAAQYLANTAFPWAGRGRW